MMTAELLADLHHLHDIIDVFRGPGVPGGGYDIEQPEVLKEQRRILVREILESHAISQHPSDDFVVHVCEVADMIHLVTASVCGGGDREACTI